MHINQKTITNLLLSCLAISMLTLSSGCRTGGFTKPDLGKLAFWKPENSIFASKANSTPPPPAQHFDPAPITGEQNSQVVDLNSGNLERRFKNDIDDMRAEIDAAAKALAQPIRTPYSSGSESAVNQLASDTKSSFESATGNVKSKLEGFESQAKSKMSSAQNEFQAAMDSTKDTMNNEFASGIKATNDMTKGWKDDFTLPTAPENNSFNGSLASVNQSLDKANTQLGSGTATSGNNSFGGGDNSFGGSFQGTMNGAIDSANGFAAATPRTISQTAPLTNSFAPLGAAAAQNSLGGSDAKSAMAAPANAELELVRSQMAEAKRQIAELKQQVQLAGQPGSMTSSPPASNSFAPSSTVAGNQPFGAYDSSPNSNYQSAPAARTAQMQAPDSGYRVASNVSLEQEPTNRLRSNEPLRPALPNSSQNQLAPQYPATSHGGFAPRSNDFSGNFSPMQAAPDQESGFADASHVDFESNNDNSMVVTANNSMSPMAGSTAAKIQSYVSDVDIPDSVLTGSGSYAPGSVHSLKLGK